MPAAWRVHVIAETLRERGITAEVRETDIYGLTGGDRHAVLDAMIAGGEKYPMVLVNARIVCSGEIEMDAIIRAAQEVYAGDDCCC